MLDYLKERILSHLTVTKPSQPSSAADPAGDLAHIEQVIRETQAEVGEAREWVEHCRQKLAEVDTRTLLDRPDVGDDTDAPSWVQELIEAQEDFSRLSAALPRLEAERDTAKLALKQSELTMCLDRIEGYKRQYADLATVLRSQLSRAADTAATMAHVSEAIEIDRTRAYALQVETVGAPTGISFIALDVLAEFRKALAKARTRLATPTSPPPPMVTTKAVVVEHTTPVVSPETLDQFEITGHIWTITPTTDGTCQHRVGNKSGPCGHPGAYQATYQPPGVRFRSWVFCADHGARWRAQHITLPAASVAERG
jgi:hypothetical protein